MALHMKGSGCTAKSCSLPQIGGEGPGTRRPRRLLHCVGPPYRLPIAAIQPLSTTLSSRYPVAIRSSCSRKGRKSPTAAARTICKDEGRGEFIACMQAHCTPTARYNNVHGVGSARDWNSRMTGSRPATFRCQPAGDGQTPPTDSLSSSHLSIQPTSIGERQAACQLTAHLSFSSLFCTLVESLDCSSFPLSVLSEAATCISALLRLHLFHSLSLSACCHHVECEEGS